MVFEGTIILAPPHISGLYYRSGSSQNHYLTLDNGNEPNLIKLFKPLSNEKTFNIERKLTGILTYFLTGSFPVDLKIGGKWFKIDVFMGKSQEVISSFDPYYYIILSKHAIIILYYIPHAIIISSFDLGGGKSG